MNNPEIIGYHGFGHTDPKLITGGDEGFDLRFSKRANYGKGNYFARSIQGCKSY